MKNKDKSKPLALKANSYELKGKLKITRKDTGKVEYVNFIGKVINTTEGK